MAIAPQSSDVSELVRPLTGELVGTFLLTFIGTSTVACAVLFGSFVGVVQVAAIWGVGVALAIYATRQLSGAHLNPAVTLAMVIAGREHSRLLVPYWGAQLVGGVAAGGAVLALFGGAIGAFEAAHGLVRGTAGSVRTAMLFGEYFPNPGLDLPWFEVSIPTAMLAEGGGTFLLVALIFLLTEGSNRGRPSDSLTPILIGGTVTTLISILAPLSQAGFNPARDLGPRLVAFLAGWGEVAIPGPQGGWLSVYVAAPLIGGSLAAVAFRFALAPLLAGRSSERGADIGAEQQ